MIRWSASLASVIRAVTPYAAPSRTRTVSAWQSVSRRPPWATTSDRQVAAVEFFAPRVEVTTPTQTTNQAARIYELEVC